MKQMKVHPIAELFPMMSDEELQSLAEDIKANGLKDPIIVDDDGQLIDGRNRHEACGRAGVEPRFEKLNGQEPVSLILSKNFARRHMTKGAMAMIAAKAYPEPEEVGRGKKGTVAVHFPMVPKGSLSNARLVVRLASEYVDDVIHGIKSLDTAYEVALVRKADAATTSEHMAKLRKQNPDLADAVSEERLSLAEALAQAERRDHENALLVSIEDDSPDLVALVKEGRMSAMDAVAADAKRREIEYNQRQGATMVLAQMVRVVGLHEADSPTPKVRADELMRHFDLKHWPTGELGNPTPELFETASELFTQCAKALKKGKS